MRSTADVKKRLESLYRKYNDRRWIRTDPLMFVYHYSGVQDREVAGLIASSLAFGRVIQIQRSVQQVLNALGPSPAATLSGLRRLELDGLFRDFKHRWITGREISELLWCTGRMISEFGSLQDCFLGSPQADQAIRPGLARFVARMRKAGLSRDTRLVASPEDGSACKRLNLFLRWMVRRDRIDTGLWSKVSPASLIVPVDVHMHRAAMRMRFTKRKQADWRTALEITRAFAQIRPDDPVRYDFALTRGGLGSRRFPDLLE